MKLPSLFPVGLFAGGILLSIELKNFALPNPRFFILAAFVLPLIGYILLRKRRTRVLRAGVTRKKPPDATLG